MLLQAVNQGQGSGMPVMDRVIQRSEGAVQDDNQNMKHPQQDNSMEGLTPHF